MLRGFSCKTEEKQRMWRNAGRCGGRNPYISRYIAQSDTAGLSGKPRSADAYLNNSFIYFCERLIRSRWIRLMKIDGGVQTRGRGVGDALVSRGPQSLQQ